MWMSFYVVWIFEYVYVKGNVFIDYEVLKGCDCYVGFDLLSILDIIVFVLVFLL